MTFLFGNTLLLLKCSRFFICCLSFHFIITFFYSLLLLCFLLLHCSFLPFYCTVAWFSVIRCVYNNKTFSQCVLLLLVTAHFIYFFVFFFCMCIKCDRGKEIRINSAREKSESWLLLIFGQYLAIHVISQLRYHFVVWIREHFH